LACCGLQRARFDGAGVVQRAKELIEEDLRLAVVSEQAKVTKFARGDLSSAAATACDHAEI